MNFLASPETDPTSIYRQRDGLYAVDMLTAALCHLDLFSRLAEQPADLSSLCRALDVRERPTDVMLTLLTAMGLLQNNGGAFSLTKIAREFLVPSSPWFIGPYFASVKERPVCRDILAVLRTDQPSNFASLRDEKQWSKAMEDEAFANNFTAAMDCRGAFLGPALAATLDCSQHHRLLDIAGGSGVYACAIVARHPHLRAGVLEKPPVDRITRRSLATRGFADRVEVIVGDMFAEALPAGFDMHLFSNVLHDWDQGLVRQLLAKSAAALPVDGMIIIHDAHINADKTGPLPVAAYSALLMTITEGKCYSEREIDGYLTEAGFGDIAFAPTAADRSVITARKMSG
ncbi:MAG TPA: methyltransferase [Verrucomicrobiae bacterium]|jgi:predicted O-methyltransferase YrrM|nr:methyltransferase [Verrucomicrobiae bacterium]